MLEHMKSETEPKISVIKLESQGSKRGGISFLEAMTLMFIGLKLTDHLQNWTWIEVFAPLWLPFMVLWFLKLCLYTFSPESEENGK